MVELSGRSEEASVKGNGKGILYASTSSSPIACDGNSMPTRKTAPKSSYYFYPQPLAKYEDVVVNAKLFMDTLGKLHATMRTKFMIPIIGGKELDLHRLFVEVTSRGGIEKVIRERRWKEVTAAFSFPSTATNASFVLRKYYVSLIHHYEQIYYFKAKGCSTASPAAAYSGQKRSRDTEEASNEASPSLGRHVVGVIDAKFEHGYLVTVTLGSDTLKGVLYHIPEQTINHVQNSTCISKDTTTPTTVRRRRRRKKCEMKKRDPDHPKPNRSGYNFFFQEQHARLKPLYPGKDREISRMIGELWNKLGEPEKSVYQEKGLRDKERYKNEMEEYREKLKGQLINTAAVPIQQQLGTGLDIEMEDADPKMDFEEGDSVQSQEHDSTTSESELEMQEMEVDKEPEKDALTSAYVAPKPVNVAADGFEPQKQIEKIEDAVYVHVPSLENKTAVSDKVGDAVDVKVLSSENAVQLIEAPIVKVEDAVDVQVTNSETVGSDGFGLQKQVEKVGGALAVQLPSSENVTEDGDSLNLQNQVEKVGDAPEVQVSSSANVTEGGNSIKLQNQIEKVGDAPEIQVPSSTNITEGGDSFKSQIQVEKVGNAVDDQVPKSENATEGAHSLESQKQVDKFGDEVDAQMPGSEKVTEGGDGFKSQKQIEKGENAVDVQVPSSENATRDGDCYKSQKQIEKGGNVTDVQVPSSEM
ncbi:high mobility group B protein 15-like isoform X2 [Papaver somniferum]|uniref:high mobility group B protein 15-like isoform X2 n=1 Tax=Papaver somniferum TaxID=3469 RepID=UPI000E6F6D4B|nr:high mobility group B protein 15-like isoform X2 [Papaver somniferum]